MQGRPSSQRGCCWMKDVNTSVIRLERERLRADGIEDEASTMCGWVNTTHPGSPGPHEGLRLRLASRVTCVRYCWELSQLLPPRFLGVSVIEKG